MLDFEPSVDDDPCYHLDVVDGMKQRFEWLAEYLGRQAAKDIPRLAEERVLSDQCRKSAEEWLATLDAYCREHHPHFNFARGEEAREYFVAKFMEAAHAKKIGEKGAAFN